jgi:nitrate/nitrite transporter NarK
MMIGGAAAPPIAARLIEAVGWRWTFVVFGAIGALWAWAFYAWFRDRPEQHPAANPAEVELINKGRAAEAHEAHPPIPWRLVLPSASVWFMGCIMICAAGVFYMLISWYPTYLQKARGAEEIESGDLAGMALAGGAIGCVIGGLLVDYLLRRTGSRRVSYCWLGCVALCTGGATLSLGLQLESRFWTSVCVAVACFCLQVQVPAWWATVTHISGRHVGALFGLMNSMGTVGAFASQVFLGSLADVLKAQGYTGRDQWDPGMAVYVGVFALGAVLWLLVNPDRSVVGDEETAPALPPI